MHANDSRGRQPNSLLLTSITALALALAAISDARSQGIPVKTSSRLNFRSAPNRGPNIVKVLPAGEAVEALPDAPQAGFFHVRTSDQSEGWAHGDYLLLPDELESAEAGVAAAAAHPASYPDCGGAQHYRWAAKATTSGLSVPPSATNVTNVLGWSALPFHGTTLGSWCQARAAKEQQAYEIEGWVRRIRKEADGDVHIEITEHANDAVTECVVVEIPPAAVSAKFQSARSDLEADLGITGIADTDFPDPKHLKFEGLAFWDGWHVKGSLPSGHGRCNSTIGAAWELHPVFNVQTP